MNGQNMAENEWVHIEGDGLDYKILVVRKELKYVGVGEAVRNEDLLQFLHDANSEFETADGRVFKRYRVKNTGDVTQWVWQRKK